MRKNIAMILENGNEGSITKGNFYDAGSDICSGETCVIKAWGSEIVSTGVKIAIPDGHVGLIKSRSGLAVKHNIEVGAGVIDSGYRGEIKVVLRNFSSVDFPVMKGDRIAQILILPVILGGFKVVDELPDSIRGENGFGSSGIN